MKDKAILLCLNDEQRFSRFAALAAFNRTHVGLELDKAYDQIIDSLNIDVTDLTLAVNVADAMYNHVTSVLNVQTA